MTKILVMQKNNPIENDEVRSGMSEKPTNQKRVVAIGLF